jgi:hypothetical protein
MRVRASSHARVRALPQTCGRACERRALHGSQAGGNYRQFHTLRGKRCNKCSLARAHTHLTDASSVGHYRRRHFWRDGDNHLDARAQRGAVVLARVAHNPLQVRRAEVHARLLRLPLLRIHDRIEHILHRAKL